MSKIEYRTLNDRAYEAIKKGLIAGDFTPGQPLVIRSLAESYGVSATPVREALQRLVAERLLVTLPNRSIAVPAMSREKFVELLRIRQELEGLAGELATPHLGKSDIIQLRAILADTDQTVAKRDSRAYLALNQKFHFSIYERANSPYLLQIIHDLWGQVGPFFNDLFDDDNFVSHANEQHYEIVAALADGDAGRVRGHIVEDISIAADALMPRLARHGDGGAHEHGLTTGRGGRTPARRSLPEAEG